MVAKEGMEFLMGIVVGGDLKLLRVLCVLCVLCVKHGPSFSNANEEILEEALQAS